MAKELKTGHWYKWTGPKERPHGWNPDGEMDFMLDGKPRKFRAHLDTRYDCAGYFDDGDWWSWLKGIEYMEEVPEPSKPTHQHNGKTYTQLKPITVKSLILDGARDRDVEHFLRKYDMNGDEAYGLTGEIPLAEAVKYCSDCAAKQKWMVEKGYWKVEEEKFEFKVEDFKIENGPHGVNVTYKGSTVVGFWHKPGRVDVGLARWMGESISASYPHIFWTVT